MLDPDGDLQEIPSSDDDMDQSELRGRIQRIRESGAGVASPEFTSPIGSPRDNDGALSAKGRFLELKRMMQDDLDSHSHRMPAKSSKTTDRKSRKKTRAVAVPGREQEDFEELGEEWGREGSVSPQSYHDDVEALLESFRSERAGEHGEYSSISQRLENHPKMIEVYQQLRERDMKILGLESRVMELDRQVIDLQDTLNERDKLLGSKNEAVNCVVNQYQQEVLEKDAELIKTQKTLFELEKNFGVAQEQWKADKQKLNAEIRQQNTRLKDLEDTNILLESARLELTSKSLELEEKLSVLKEDRNKLTQENSKIISKLEEGKIERESIEKLWGQKTEEYVISIEELKGSLEKSAEQMTKMKQQFQVKLKTLKDQLKERTTDGDQQAKILTLENRIAEIEEEKGNLLLSLEELSQFRNEREVQEKESLILMQDEISKVKNEKASLEKDFLERIGDYEKNFEERVDEYEKKIEECEKKIAESEEILTDSKKTIIELNTSVDKSKEQMTKMKRLYQTKLKAAKEEQRDNNPESEAQGKILILENRIAELEDEKGNNLWIQEELTQIKSEKETLEKGFEDKSSEYERRIEVLSDLLEKSSEQINRLEQRSEVNFSVVRDQPKDSAFEESDVQQARITNLEHQVAELEEEKGSGFLLEEELSRMKLERETMEKTYEEKSAEHENKIEELNAALAKSTELMTKMKRQFQVKLKALKEDRKENSPTSSELEIELQAKITALENQVAELEEEKGNLLLQMVDFDEQQASRQEVNQDSNSLQEETIKLEINLAEKEEELRLVQEQLNEMTAALSQKNGEVEQLMMNCSEMQQSLQQKVDDLSGSVNAKEEEIRRVIQEYEEDYRLANERIAVLEQESSASSNQLESKNNEILSLNEKLTIGEKRLEETSVFVNQYQDMLEGAREQDQSQLVLLQQELETIKEKTALAEKSYETMKSGYAEETHLRLKTISELQEQLNRMTLDMSIQDTECCEMAKASADLQQRFETAEILFRNSDTEYRNQIEQLNTKLLSNEFEIEQLKFVAETYQNSLESQVTTQERELHLKAVEDELRSQISVKDASIDSLNSQLSVLQLEKLQVSTLSEENDSLKIKISELSSASEALQRELNALREHYVETEASYNELNTELGQKSAEVERLLVNDSQSKTVLLELQNEIANKNLILEEFNLKISTLENEKTQLALRQEEAVEENHSLKIRLTELNNDYGRLSESFETKDAESLRLREDANTLQSEYADTNNELKLKISTLMDQLNDCENEISVVSARLKESDDSAAEVKARLVEFSAALEEKSQALEGKSRALETAEHSIFEKTEDLVHLEEKLREVDEKHRLVLEENLLKYSDDLDATYDQLAATANENVILQEKLKKRLQEIEDMSAQLATVTGQNSNRDTEFNDYRDRINYLENQLMSAGRQLEEVKFNENQVSLRVMGLQRELEEKQLSLQELTVELEEVRNLRVNAVTETALQQAPLSIDEYSKHFADLTAGLEARDRRIYELEVQLTELQITVDDANIQMDELAEVKASVEIISYKLQESEEANSKLKYEMDQLVNERARNVQKFLDLEAVSGPSPSVISVPASIQMPVEEDIIRATAYTTTDTSVPTHLEQERVQTSANQAQFEQYLKEIKELKVKNGKMIQRFKQLKDKYDAVVRENEELKTKKSFSLDSAFEDEFLSQVQQKEALLEDKVKLITDLQTDNQRLSEKLDLLERGTERLTDMKEEQDRTVQELLTQRRGLETEVSALKWKVEELENISLTRAGGSPSGDPGSENAYFDINLQDQVNGENTSLRQQNYVMSQELVALQVEIESQKKSVDELNERNQQLEEEIEKLQELQIEQHETIEKKSIPRNTSVAGATKIEIKSTDVVDAVVSPIDYSTEIIPLPHTSNPQTYDSSETVSTANPSGVSLPILAISTEPQVLDNRIDSLQKTLQSENQEKLILEKKIELLQSKISEIEVSEMKCFEESLMLKSWTRQLELDNLKIQRELERIYSSVQEGETGNLKVKVLQDEVLRLVDALHDRDKRCEELTMEITRLLEERDTLQLKLSNVLRHNVSLHEEANKGKEPPSIVDSPVYDKVAIQMKLAELEQITYSMGIDLRREREARRLVQEQLFFSTSSRIYPSSGKQSQSPGRGSPAPPSSPYQIRPSTPQQSASALTTPAQQQQYFQPVTPPALSPVQSTTTSTFVDPQLSPLSESPKPSSIPVVNI